MKKFLLFILLIPIAASAQSQRYDSFAATLTSASGIGNITQVIPNATITVFNQPAAGVNCSAGGCVAATTFTSRTGVTPCGGGLPLTRPTSATCIATADSAGNFGFWAAAGAYQYCVAATSITTQCFNVALGAPIDGVINGVYYPNICGTSNPPSWCAGADIGAWVNAAAANCPNAAGACRLHISGSASCLSFTTPIVFGSGKFVTLEGEAGGGTCIKYTPTTGSAILFDPGVSEHQAYGIRDLQLIGPGSGTTAIGVQLASSNGAEGILISGFRTGTTCCNADGFGTGIQITNGTAFVVTIEKSFIQGNGVGLGLIGSNTENIKVFGNSFSHNSTNNILASGSGWVDIYSLGNSYDDSGPISLPSVGGFGNHFTSSGDHFENASVGTAAQPYITMASNSHVTLMGDVMLDDRLSSTNTGMIACSGSSLVYIYGMVRANNGITVNPFLNASGSCRAWLQFSQSTGTFTDYSTAYTGGSIFDSNFTFNTTASLTLANGNQSANSVIPYGSNVTTGLTANMGSTQLGAATTLAGIYQVCVAMFPTATGSATAIQGTVSSNDGNAYTINIGPVLSTAALTNVASGCLPIPAGSGVTISVATTGYSGTGTYTVRSEVNQIQ